MFTIYTVMQHDAEYNLHMVRVYLCVCLACRGGMGVRETRFQWPKHAFTTSRTCTNYTVQAIKGTIWFSLFDHKQHLLEVRSEMNRQLDQQ